MILLRNANGVVIETEAPLWVGQHLVAQSVTCCCGDILFISPPAFDSDHIDATEAAAGDPMMTCCQGHEYRFSELVPGKQSGDPTAVE